jgi:hypothetical protein
MQHTLLPLHERITLRREYRIRAAIVLCFTLSLVGLIGIASFFPAFLKASTEARSAQNEAAILQKNKKDSGLTSIQQTVAQSQKLLSTLGGKVSGTKMSAIIESIVSMRNNVRLTSINVTQTGTTTATIVMQGVAPTRDALLSFKNRLESAVPGNKVELPVSELAKSTNVEFSMRLTENLP